MILKRIKSEGIAQFSYLIASGNDAAVIDPRRDCRVYVEFARRHGLRIGYIFETHRNEDFVIGSLPLKSMTGAEIYHGPGLDWKYGATLKDGQAFHIGELRLTALHTPGHTDESMCYSVADTATGPQPVMVFTGDTLFVGDVGRTDLYGQAEAPRLAANLYDSIANKLLPLGDGVIIYPAHGGGSVCGGHIAEREESTIGIERASNRALQFKSKGAFVKYKTAETLETPYYFKQMERYNLEGPPLTGDLPSPLPLTPAEFKREMEKGALVVDTREPPAFGGLHIEAAYSIWLEGLPNFAGWVLPYDKPLLLVTEDHADLRQAVSSLFRTGHDKVIGYLNGGMSSWYNAGSPIQSMGLLSVHRLRHSLEQGDEITVLDARSRAEWETGYIDDATHIYVGHLEKRISEVPRDKPIAVYCESGNRASLAASILLRAGFPTVHNVPGSMSAWEAAGFPVTRSRVRGAPA